MNKEIFIKENFKVDDSHSKVRGFVFAYDENDNLIFAKENMIVRTGRQYIMKHGLKQDSSFKCAFLSTNSDMVTEGDTIADLGTPGVGYITTNESVNFSTDIISGLNTDNDFDDIKIDNDAYYASGERLILENNVDVLYNHSTWKWTGEKLQKEGYEDVTPNTNTIIEYNNMIYRFFKDNPNTETIETTYNKFLSVALTADNYFAYKVDDSVENLVIRCLIVFNGTNAIAANSLGLITEDDELFSRVTFPTYYKSATQRLTFKYYIYF